MYICLRNNRLATSINISERINTFAFQVRLPGVSLFFLRGSLTNERHGHARKSSTSRRRDTARGLGKEPQLADPHSIFKGSRSEKMGVGG